ARATPPLSADERERILGLAEDLPALWHAPTTTAAERKQLLRFLVQDVTLTKQAGAIALAIRWQTPASTRAEGPRPPGAGAAPPRRWSNGCARWRRGTAMARSPRG